MVITLASITDLEGSLVGAIERQDGGGLPSVHIWAGAERWYEIADAINQNIREGRPLSGRDNNLIRITVDIPLDTALEIITHTVRVLSCRRLRVQPVS